MILNSLFLKKTFFFGGGGSGIQIKEDKNLKSSIPNVETPTPADCTAENAESASISARGFIAALKAWH